MQRLTLQFQILFFYLSVGISYLTTKFFEYCAKFMYLYLMNDDQKIKFRDQVAGRLREIRSMEDPSREMVLAKMEVIKFYAWLCKNQPED